MEEKKQKEDSNLKKARNDKDQTQQQVANILMVRQEQYSRWERKPSTMPISHYITLAREWDISIDFLSNATLENTPFYKGRKQTEQTGKILQVKLLDSTGKEIVQTLTDEEFAMLKQIIKLIRGKERKKNNGTPQLDSI